MAIGRYHEFGQTDPTSNFFKLDYEMLAQPILKADKEYNETQAAYDSYLTQMSSQEILPKDLPGLQERIKKIQDEEKRLRNTASGDILQPVYQEGLRELVKQQTNDP